MATISGRREFGINGCQRDASLRRRPITISMYSIELAATIAAVISRSAKTEVAREHVQP